MVFEETNMVLKPIEDIDIRFALISPNEYNLAMQTLDYQLLYQFLNERKDCFCERIIYPSVESIETNTNLAEFDILNFTMHYTWFNYFNMVDMLKKANIPPLRKDRSVEDSLIIANGPSVTANPMPLSDFIDIFFISNGEHIFEEFLDLYNKFENPKKHLKEFAKIEGVYIPELNNQTDIVLIKDMNEKYHNTKPIKVGNDEKNRINRIYLDVARGCSRSCRFCINGYLYKPIIEASVEKLLDVAEKSRKNSGINTVLLTADAIADYSGFDELVLKLKQRNFNIELTAARIESLTPETLEYLKESGANEIAINPESVDRIRKSMNKDIPEDIIQEVIRNSLEIGLNIRFSFMLGFPNETKEDIIDLANYIKSIVNTKNSINEDLYVRFRVSLVVPKPRTPLQWEAYDLDLMKSKIDLFLSQFDDFNLELLKYTQIRMVYMDKSNNFILDINSNESTYKEYILSCGDCDVGELLVNGNINSPLSEWKKYFKSYEVGDALPWDIINIGYKNNFIEKEHSKIRNGKLTPWCDVSPCYNCKDNCYKNPKTI